MCKYKRGEVVWALCLHGERKGVKVRPCIILNVKNDICNYHVQECYSLLDKHSNNSNVVKVIKEHSIEFNECGFENDTVITKNRGWLFEKYLRVPPPPPVRKNPMGICTFINEIDPPPSTGIAASLLSSKK